MKEENIKGEYQRKVDKSLIPTCNIMGVNIAAINMNWLFSFKWYRLKARHSYIKRIWLYKYNCCKRTRTARWYFPNLSIKHDCQCTDKTKSINDQVGNPVQDSA